MPLGSLRRRLGVLVPEAAVMVTILVVLLPMLWALSAAFTPITSLFDANPLPVPGTLAHYTEALTYLPLGPLLLRTLAMALGVTLLSLLLALPAAYALLHATTRGAELAWSLVAGALLVPPQALVIPHFLAVAELDMIGTLPGLILPQLGTSALAVLLLRDQIRQIPGSVIDAALLDGATPWERLRHVVLPLSRPALVAVGTLMFINTWNEYLWPLIAGGGSITSTTIQPGLALFNDPVNPRYGPLMAASILASVPVVAVYLLFSRRIVGTFLSSGAGRR